MSCLHCEVRPVGPFRSPKEVLDLEASLQDHAVLRLVPTPAGWPSYGLEERFYRCEKCEQQWHYAQPDGPYKGIWEKL